MRENGIARSDPDVHELMQFERKRVDEPHRAER